MHVIHNTMYLGLLSSNHWHSEMVFKIIIDHHEFAGRKNFDDSTCIRQIRQIFPPSKFYTIWYNICSALFLNIRTLTCYCMLCESFMTKQ